MIKDGKLKLDSVKTRCVLTLGNIAVRRDEAVTVAVFKINCSKLGGLKDN